MTILDAPTAVARLSQEPPGSVVVNGRNVTVESGSPNMSIREHYLVADRNNFVYRLDVSTDGGRTWNEGHIVMTLRRLE